MYNKNLLVQFVSKTFMIYYTIWYFLIHILCNKTISRGEIRKKYIYPETYTIVISFSLFDFREILVKIRDQGSGYCSKETERFNGIVWLLIIWLQAPKVSFLSTFRENMSNRYSKLETDAFNSRLIFKFMSRHRGGCDRSTPWSKAFIQRALSFSRIYDYQIVNSLMKTDESHHFMHFFRSLNLDTDVIKYVCRLHDVIFVHLRISRMI